MIYKWKIIVSGRMVIAATQHTSRPSTTLYINNCHFHDDFNEGGGGGGALEVLYESKKVVNWIKTLGMPFVDY